MAFRCLLSSIVLAVSIGAATYGQPITQFVNSGRGDVPLYLPSDYDGTQELPLIVGLHGRFTNPNYLELYFDLLTQIDSKQFIYLTPFGTVDPTGNSFWDVTEEGLGSIDDSTYLRGLVDLVQSEYPVDPQSIHFTGHSNGGFMSHRMAIDYGH